MGNLSNPEAWAAQERLRFIERCLYWRGWIKRKDLAAVFGISPAQATADFQRYQELNPVAMRYDLRVKQYWGTREMACVLQEPDLGEALTLFLDGVAAVAGAVPGRAGLRPDREDGAARVVLLRVPQRSASVVIQRQAFQAVSLGRLWRIRYWSVSARGERWREIGPHAFAHDGSRWHVRAWCAENGDYRDFVLGRIEAAGWPEEECVPPRPDTDWETFETLRLRPWSGLTETQRQAIELDYGMKGGEVRIRVRRALRYYLVQHLRLEAAGPEAPPRHLELAEASGEAEEGGKVVSAARKSIAPRRSRARLK